MSVAQQVVDNFGSIISVTSLPYTDRTFFLQMYLIYRIVNELARFGEEILSQLTKKGCRVVQERSDDVVLRFILKNFRNKEMGGQIALYSQQYLDSIYGSRNAPLSTLDLNSLFEIAYTPASYAVIRALIEINNMLPSLIKTVRDLAMNPLTMQRAVASVQLSYRQSLKSISFLHTPVEEKEKEKAVFEDDFLNHSIIYGFNKQQDIDYALQCARESEVLKKPITSIKRISTGQSALRSSSQSVDLEDKDKMDTFKYLAESVAYLRGLLSNAKRDTFGKQSSNVVKLLGRIITYYCFSPHLATLLLDKRMWLLPALPGRHRILYFMAFNAEQHLVSG